MDPLRPSYAFDLVAEVMMSEVLSRVVDWASLILIRDPAIGSVPKLSFQRSETEYELKTEPVLKIFSYFEDSGFSGDGPSLESAASWVLNQVMTKQG